MEIYTLVMTKESFANPPCMEVFGSFRTAEKAKAELIGNMVKMAQKDQDFACALWYDENHEDFREAMAQYETSFIRESEAAFPAGAVASMWEYLGIEIGDGEGSYYVYCSVNDIRDATYRFDIVKNTLGE